MSTLKHDRTDSLQYVSNLEEDLKLSAEIGAALLTENEEMKEYQLTLLNELQAQKAANGTLQRRNDLAAQQLKHADTTIAELSQRVSDLKLDNQQAHQRVHLSEQAHSATKTKLMAASSNRGGGGASDADDDVSRSLEYGGAGGGGGRRASGALDDLGGSSRFQSPNKAAHNRAREKIAELSDELTELRTELMATKESALERRQSRLLMSAARQTEEHRVAQLQAESMRQAQQQLSMERDVARALHLQVSDLESAYAAAQQLVGRQNFEMQKLGDANDRLSSQNLLASEFQRQEAERAMQAHVQAMKDLEKQQAGRLAEQEGACAVP
jgi:hypothetical protein